MGNRSSFEPILRAGIAGRRLLLLVWLAVAGPAFAGDYYVRMSGDDLADGLTLATAWRTIAHAENEAAADAVIHVLQGDYSEDSDGLGFLKVDEDREDRSFVAEGLVRIRAAASVSQIVQFSTAARHSFEGFSFDGEGAVSIGIISNSGNKVIRDCDFAGCLSRAFYLNSADSVTMEDCRFGTAAVPLNCNAIRIDGTSAFRVLGCEFFTNSGDVVRFDESDDCEAIGNRFGSIEHPIQLWGASALIAVDSHRSLFAQNEMHLLVTDGIVIPNANIDAMGPRIVGNDIRYYSESSAYPIFVGSEDPAAAKVIGAQILDNVVVTPVGETVRHVIFAGFAEAPLIEGNRLTGGGYGIVSKDNDGAILRGNRIEGTSTNGILDKGCHNSVISANVFLPEAGPCARVTNDEVSGRFAYNSIWNANIFSPALFCIELSDPVDPFFNTVSFDSSLYCLGSSGQAVASIHGILRNVYYLRDSYDWELNSTISPVAPVVLQLPGNGAINMPTSVLLSWQDGGATAWQVQLSQLCGAGEIVESIVSEQQWDDLLTAATYFWRVRALSPCGRWGEWSDCYSFETSSEPSALPAGFEGGLRFNGVYPNPSSRNCRFSFSLADAGPVSLEIYDIRGRRVRVLLAEESLGRGEFTREWTGLDDSGAPVTAGVYFGRLTRGGSRAIRKFSWLGNP